MENTPIVEINRDPIVVAVTGNAVLTIGVSSLEPVLTLIMPSMPTEQHSCQLYIITTE